MSRRKLLLTPPRQIARRHAKRTVKGRKLHVTTYPLVRSPAGPAAFELHRRPFHVKNIHFV
jgi:hypothetical protein